MKATLKTSLAIAALCGAAANAQNEDATARAQAQAATSAANTANTVNEAQSEKLDAVEGKLGGLEESYLETKSIVDGLKKLKVSGLVQAQYVFRPDTNLVSTSRPMQQGLFQVRRGRLKATYDAGNGATYVMQYNLNQTGLSAQDMYVKWEEPWLKTFSFQMGLQDIPFGYEVSYSSSSMETLERSLFERNAMFKDEKDVGFILGITPQVDGLDALGLKLAVLNGSGITDGIQDPSCYVGRLNLGKNFYDAGVGVDVGASYYMDSRLSQSKAIKYKAAGKTDQDSVGSYYDIDGSANFLKGDFRKELSANVWGLDAQVGVDLSMIPGFSGAKFSGEFYQGTAIGVQAGNTRSIAVPEILYLRDLMGFYVTYVQNFGNAFQSVARFESYDPNTNVEGKEIGDKTANSNKGNGTSKSDLAYTNIYLGVNWFATPNTKLTLGYDILTNEKSSSLKNSVPVSDFSKDIDDNTFTLRAQYMF